VTPLISGSIRAAAKLIRLQERNAAVLPEARVNMNATRSSKLPPSDWVTRCIQQIRHVEPGLSEKEAADVAQQLLAFERTGAMPPEEAVKFVVAELAGQTPRFERRSPSRLSTTIRL